MTRVQSIVRGGDEAGRIFVLAPRRQAAIEWCYGAGISPHSKSTIILTTPESTRGHEFRPGDTAYFLGVSPGLEIEWMRIMDYAGISWP